MTTTQTTMQPPLYPYSRKKEGDRVKVAIHPASLPNSKFVYGTIRKGYVLWDNYEKLPSGLGLPLAADALCLMDA